MTNTVKKTTTHTSTVKLPFLFVRDVSGLNSEAVKIGVKPDEDASVMMDVIVIQELKMLAAAKGHLTDNDLLTSLGSNVSFEHYSEVRNALSASGIEIQEEISSADKMLESMEKEINDAKSNSEADSTSDDALSSLEAYCADIRASVERGDIRKLSAEEEIELAEKIAKGDKNARKTMIMCNLPLAISYAKRFSHLGIEFIDLIEEANIGLIKAVKKFDPSRKCRFSTCAHWWIRQSIIKALHSQRSLIRRSGTVSDLERKIYNATEAYMESYGCKPGVNTLARILKTQVDKVYECLIYMETLNPTSLDQYIKGKDQDDNTTLGEMVADAASEDPFDAVAKIQLGEMLNEAIDNALTEEEAAAVRLHFGIDYIKPFALEETGKLLGKSAKEASKLVKSAVKKLIKSPEAQKAKSFW